MHIADSPEQILTPTSIALGNFDGIHRGHQKVLEKVFGQDDRQGTKYTYPTVVSFSPHPREFFTGKKLKLLTPVAEKAQQLDSLGIKQLALLSFDRELASLTPAQFVEKILVQQLQAKYISVGEDFRFGFQRKGTATDLKAIASNLGINVYINALHKCQDRSENVRISSSLIRQALQAGEIEQANSMLGRAYSLMGKVVKGQQLGRTIGFPTANLQVPSEKFLPRYGVYSVNVFLKDNPNFQIPIKSVMNIGYRPTVQGDAPTIEVHLLNWSGDLYDRTISVSLERFLRPEQKFPSLEALKRQIAADCQAALLC